MDKQPSLPRITIVPGVCGGKPTIRGLRITVSTVLELLASGMTEKQILVDYPYLESDDIKACLNFAARLSSYSSDSFPKAV
jgi:uncharacterized protein (DUF433 family)